MSDTQEKRHWGEVVVECVSDKAERERLIRFYDYDELVQACLALGTLALTAKTEYQKNAKLERENAALREALIVTRLHAEAHGHIGVVAGIDDVLSRPPPAGGHSGTELLSGGPEFNGDNIPPVPCVGCPDPETCYRGPGCAKRKPHAKGTGNG